MSDITVRRIKLQMEYPVLVRDPELRAMERRFGLDPMGGMLEFPIEIENYIVVEDRYDDPVPGGDVLGVQYMPNERENMFVLYRFDDRARFDFESELKPRFLTGAVKMTFTLVDEYEQETQQIIHYPVGKPVDRVKVPDGLWRLRLKAFESSPVKYTLLYYGSMLCAQLGCYTTKLQWRRNLCAALGCYRQH